MIWTTKATREINLTSFALEKLGSQNWWISCQSKYDECPLMLKSFKNYNEAIKVFNNLEQHYEIA
jgi:hypothetical protein